MRMWMVNPKVMCRQHLLGEHVEIHMFLGAMRKGYSMLGYVENGLLEVKSLKGRHDDLVAEMLRRGYQHNSPLPDYTDEVLQRLSVIESVSEVPRKEAFDELLGRCQRCRSGAYAGEEGHA